TVDLSELETALVNLTINARDAMPSGGTIMIATRNLAADEPDGRAHAAISVSDGGFGIAPDVLNKVFDPFFTTKPVGKGTGLGLSQVHGFAHQAEGTVTVESVVNKGTTFTLFLPRADETDRDPKPMESPSRAIGTVLLVEDNPDVASASGALLEQL